MSSHTSLAEDLILAFCCEDNSAELGSIIKNIQDCWVWHVPLKPETSKLAPLFFIRQGQLNLTPLQLQCCERINLSIILKMIAVHITEVNSFLQPLDK